MKKVLIVEDHELIRFGLRTAFESKGVSIEILEASTGEEAISIAKTNELDAIILDLGLPSINGIDTAIEIKKIKNDVKIIILTSHNSEKEVIDSIRAGARAYCSKDINPDRLVTIVQEVIDGALWFDSKISKIVLSSIIKEKSSSIKQIEEYNLTDREIEVLEYVCEGLNNGEISKILDVSVNTVKVHVSSIIQKLGVEDRTQVVVKAYKTLKLKP